VLNRDRALPDRAQPPSGSFVPWRRRVPIRQSMFARPSAKTTSDATRTAKTRFASAGKTRSSLISRRNSLRCTDAVTLEKYDSDVV